MASFLYALYIATNVGEVHNCPDLISSFVNIRGCDSPALNSV
jgi:hypothetical protein